MKFWTNLRVLREQFNRIYYGDIESLFINGGKVGALIGLLVANLAFYNKIDEYKDEYRIKYKNDALFYRYLENSAMGGSAGFLTGVLVAPVLPHIFSSVIISYPIYKSLMIYHSASKLKNDNYDETHDSSMRYYTSWESKAK